ncbi:Plant intracellular Ras-group-related LRR protein 5 isoform B [Glycine soja]|uniref:Plant intracellular Ras-group-related LRR protein 5 isoform B n=1 Tax=Glycine soja TaxID=3848 RepID=A0A445G774_GLYSO|nr:Plant intracellular Ras-group-related LRR protein 5 isoform B [Glycine soja]
MATRPESEKDPPQPPSRGFLATVQEITRIYSSLPPRPSIEEVEAATSTVDTLNNEEQIKLNEISMQQQPPHDDVPQDLFSVLQQLKKTMVLFHTHQQRRDALYLLELENMFQTFGDLIQRASELVSGDTQKQKLPTIPEEHAVITEESETLVKEEEGRHKNVFHVVKPSLSAGDGSTEKLSLMKVATVIESCAGSGATILELRGKLVDQMEWLPVSIGKLSDVTEMDLSENRLMALPTTIVGLKALTKLDLHSNQLINLPHSFGELINLVDLDLHANKLKSLPATFGNLTNLTDLDLSSNGFTDLPETIGNLSSLKRLNVETNELEELPYTIGNCSSLSVLKLDLNQLKALPEAIGKLECLEILTLHYNRVKRLPSTMDNLCNLKELDVSFNELEFVPESLCFATNLKKLNLGKNFADLRALPASIGNLEMLEELDISDDQIKALPESFRFLSKLRVFRADETPLDLPPRELVKLGSQLCSIWLILSPRGMQNLCHQRRKRRGFGSGFAPYFAPN